MCQVDFGGPAWSKLNVAKIQSIKIHHMSSMMHKLLIILFI